jgi:hypothetical protein
MIRSRPVSQTLRVGLGVSSKPGSQGPGKATAEIHDYHDAATPVLAASLAKRAPGYTGLGFPDPGSKIK